MIKSGPFVWIADNVAYDYKFVNRNKKTEFPKCKNGKDCGTIYKKWEDNFLHKVIKDKKAVCEGYARLFKRLCNNAGIQSSVVSGYTKQEPGQVGKMGKHDHAWNAILVDGHFYYFDVTWGSGYCTHDEKGKLENFHKRFNDYYWLIPADKLYRNHFPSEEIYLNDSDYTKERYRDNAYIKGDQLPYLEIIEPKSGVLHAKPGDTIHFKINYKADPEILQINTNIKDKSGYRKIVDEDSGETEMEEIEHHIPFKRDGDTIEFEYVIDSKNIRYIDVLFDYNRVMRFNVKF
ncbi:transglutaminase domain-containing protein [Flavobacterium album]|uniref:transglutaminase domain-containing protein n=1 Tax=Flavobacterium album TaxID=2175091 RepID=UPI0015E7FDCD|nr:transglutaminase domain-containing protein [Flavobacterium album]